MLLSLVIPTFLFFFTLSKALDPKTVIDANGVSLWEKIEELERQLLLPPGLNSLVNPCAFNALASPFEGQQTSAEWVRIVFHDVITKNIAGPGLGGLDASIQFESDRPENIGVFINVTLGQFSLFKSVFLSLSDLIGVGLSDALATCDNNHRRIPLQAGRLDAIEAGPAGVPKPADTLDFTLAAFKRAGFTSSEMIQAVACGHSLGGVHGSDFPDIGGPSTDENTSGRAPFDSTPANFDNNGVNEYLTGTGLRGGPLVVGQNATENSDLRIFSYDNNVTITAMSAAQAFEDTCFTVFAKMMSTVPDTVTLSDPFLVRPWIMRESHLDLTPSGELNFTGTITTHSAAPPSTASYIYNTNRGGNTRTETSAAGAAVPGGFLQPINPDDPPTIEQLGYESIFDYIFGDILVNNPTVTGITVTSPGSTYNGTINTDIFALPSQTFVQQNSGGTGIWQLRAAILKTLSTPFSAPTAIAWYNLPQPNSVGLKTVASTGTLVFETTLGDYNIFKTSNFFGNPLPPLSLAPAVVFQVKLGTELTSAKLNCRASGIQTGCTDSDIGKC